MNPHSAHPAPPLPLSAKAARTLEQPISFLINAAMANPNLINFAAGLVDPLTLPVAECAAITRDLFADPARARVALQYDTTLGLKPLRHALLGHLESLENKPAAAMGLSADHLLLTTGSQQALYLIGDVLLNPGDLVIAESPSYFVYAGALASLGATILGVPMDEDGMDLAALERLLSDLDRTGQLPRLKLIYVTSYYQNPTGLTLSLERRPRLLELARRFSKHHRLMILEDAAYRELRYDGQALPSIKSFDTDNRHTILTQTFSKPFAPGIKLGYTALPPDLLEPILHQKGNHDFGSASLCQHIALSALQSGAYLHHVEVLKNAYRLKRDAILQALDSTLSPQHAALNTAVSWTVPGGGLYTWLTLPVHVDTSKGSDFFNAAVEAGVLYVPGDYCFHADAAGHLPRNHLRLSFGQVALEQIRPGVERLASVIDRFLPSGTRQPATGNLLPAGPRA
jgi:2-aminoadipate transaminase